MAYAISCIAKCVVLRTLYGARSIIHLWCHALNQSSMFHELLVDFAQTFDGVHRNILLAKLKDRHVDHCLVRGFHIN